MAGAFLSGYNAQRQADQQNTLGGLQQVTGVLSLQNTMRQQAEQDAVRGVLAQSPNLDAALPKLLQIGQTGISAAMQLAQVQQALKKETLGQPIGAGGLRMPDGTIVAPAARPVQEQPHPIGAGGLRLPSGEVIPPVGGPPKEQWGEPFNLNGVTVQRNAANGQIRTAVTREPQIRVDNPPPITSVTIADPSDPNKTIIVDGRTGRKIGDGPKLTATGAIDVKLQQQMPQAKLRVNSITQNLNRLDAALNDLERSPGLSNITGTIAGRTPNLTNTATSAQAKLNSIKSQIFQSSIQAMREASKTGGAVGNVSDREGDKLERTIAALDQAQGTSSFRDELKKARQQVKLSLELIDNAYKEQFGNVQPYQPGGGGTPKADPLGIR